MERYCTAGQATDDNMAHVHCTLDSLGYKHKLLRKYNTYCLSTATVVAQTCLNVVCTLPVLFMLKMAVQRVIGGFRLLWK
jgi:hypothetical protein